MIPLYLGAKAHPSPLRDVAKPQTATINNIQCHLHFGSAMICKGRTQAVYTSHLGSVAGQSAAIIPQKTRSRGCRRAQKQFWHSALLLSLQLAARKKNPKSSILKTWFPKSRFTPVNTSNTRGRAVGALGAMPALFLSAPIRIGGAA